MSVSMTPHDSNNFCTHLLGRRKSFPTHDAAEILSGKAGFKEGLLALSIRDGLAFYELRVFISTISIHYRRISAS